MDIEIIEMQRIMESDDLAQATQPSSFPAIIYQDKNCAGKLTFLKCFQIEIKQEVQRLHFNVAASGGDVQMRGAVREVETIEISEESENETSWTKNIEEFCQDFW